MNTPQPAPPGATTTRLALTSRPANPEPVFAIVGNPNCGKTTLFNALTGLRQKVGNYPGVTVERKEGECWSQHGKLLKIIDLPGAYSMNARSPDEAVLRDVLLGRRADTPRPDRVICVVDASNLERNLYLVSQILELGLPVILVLNMIDIAEARGQRIDAAGLAERLGIPVVPMQASTKKGLLELKAEMSRAEQPPAVGFQAAIPLDLRAALEQTRAVLGVGGVVSATDSLLEPLYLLSDHDPTHYGIRDIHLGQLRACREKMNADFPAWEDRLVATRYEAISGLLDGLVHSPDDETATLTDKLDSWLLHKVWGWVFLAGFLSFLFYCIFTVAEIPKGWIDAAFTFAAEKVNASMAEGDLRSLIVDGAIAGVQGIAVFLPQMLILFFFIGLVEDTGYMARIAFIMDRLMGRVGLNGKSFLPLLSSYACAVPGVMATRSIDNPKDRLITILVAPLSSCSARLPVYLLMISTLVPSASVPAFTKVLFIIGLYLLGTGGAFFFAWLFSRGLMKGAPVPLILELPSYKAPALRGILMHMWERTRVFVRRAGTVILGISILLWAASSFPRKEGDTHSDRLAHSYAGRLGHAIEPAIAPLGYDWKIGIGLIASFAAREVFVTTMGVIYSVESSDDDDIQPLRDRLREEKRPDGTPVYTPLVCISLMVFYVFAMQCISTIAVVRRETNSWRWPLFQLGYMTGTAWLLSFLVYQIGTRLGF